MSMGEPIHPGTPGALDEEVEEITVDITEEGMVWLHGEEWELVLSPGEARQLGDALRDAADDAEAPVE
jgi:hypothetical protein